MSGYWDEKPWTCDDGRTEDQKRADLRASEQRAQQEELAKAAERRLTEFCTFLRSQRGCTDGKFRAGFEWNAFSRQLDTPGVRQDSGEVEVIAHGRRATLPATEATYEALARAGFAPGWWGEKERHTRLVALAQAVLVDGMDGPTATACGKSWDSLP